MTRLPERTYKTVALARSGEGHAILLDGTPAKVASVVIQVPTRALAEAIAEEWREQEKHLDPEPMRLTALGAAALNRVAAARGEVIEHVLGYGRNELLCYRALEPAELAARQKAHWDALLEWIHGRHGIRLIADAGVTFIEQPVDALVRMQEIVSGLDDFELAALDAAASRACSFVVALALVERHIGGEEAFAVSHLEELYQAEKWGRDADAQSRRTHIIAELTAVERFVSLLSD
jgi:chaperone required for assembly of F1-ATPase